MQLGITVRDVITGFQGVVIGYVEYITGCNQALVQPRSAEGITDKRPEAEWFDVQRLQQVHAHVLTLDNSETPGCDIPAPKR